MATSSSTRSPTRCSGPPAWATSAGSSRPTPDAAGDRQRGAPGRGPAVGWRPPAGDRPRVDLTIVAARPRLGAHLDPMREAIAGLLGLDPDAVNVKASTGNLDGAEGAGRGISALVVATLEAAS